MMLEQTQTQTKLQLLESQEIVTDVFSTMDYEMFEMVDINRIVDASHVEKLTSNFEDEYLVSPILVSINENTKNYSIIEGQHRFVTAKQMGLPIYFYISNEPYGIKEIQMINSRSRKWNGLDYFNGYCNANFNEYLKLKLVMDTYNFLSLTKARQIVSEPNYGSLRIFKDGTFRIRPIEEFEEKLLNVKEFIDLGFVKSTSATFIEALTHVMSNSNYNHSRLIKQFTTSKSADKLKKKLNEKRNRLDIIEALEDAYNMNKSANSKVSFKYQ